MDRCFETSYDALLEKVDQIDPMAYGKTRNFIDGAVTCLSPYISRGVISTQQVLQQVLVNICITKGLTSLDLQMVLYQH